MTKRIVMSVLAGAVLAAAPAVQAGGLAVFKCGAGKQKAVSKDESGQAGCWSKNVLKPDTGGTCSVSATACNVTDDCPSGETCVPGPILGACLSKARGGLGTAFDKLLLKPPPCPGDKTTVGAEVDNCVANLVDAISSDGHGHIDSGQQKCAAGKLKAAGKGAAGQVGCHSKESGKGGLCSVSVAVPCGTDSDCRPTGTCATCQPTETCIAVPPAKVCSVSLAKCSTDGDCGGSGGNCVDACLKKVTDKTRLGLQKLDTSALCAGSLAHDEVAVQAVIDSQCVTTITNGLPGKEVACGNGVIDPSLNETCDDGNLDDGDGCPSSCQVASCLPVSGTLSAHVTLTQPAGINVAGVQMFVDYPEGKVSGSGLGTSFGFGINGQATDIGYGLNVAEAKNPPAALPSTILTMTFHNLCNAAPAATAADFHCVVTSAADDQLNDINLTAHPVSCTISVP